MSNEINSVGFYQQIVFHVRETSVAAIEFLGNPGLWEVHHVLFRLAFNIDMSQRTARAQGNKAIFDNTSFRLRIYIYLHGVQVSLMTILILVSHIGRHEGRKSEMVSKGGQCYQNQRLEMDLSPGRGKHLVSNIPATFVLTKCLLIEVESPVGFSLVNW